MRQYYCPMHPEVQSNRHGNCPKCGMRLVKRGEEEKHTSKDKNFVQTSIELVPLFVVIIVVIVFTFLWAFLFKLTSWNDYARIFMGGFFLIFSSFKLVDIRGFATAYQTYDLLAKRSRAYALSYPFIEFFLGLAFLASFQLKAVSLVTFLLMGFSAIGVLIALSSHRKFLCACLGTKLKLPMTQITLAEDLLMSGMALLMFLL